MKTNITNCIQYTLLALLVCCSAGFLLLGIGVHAQNTASEQMKALAPDTQDLQGFTRIRPAGELSLNETYSPSAQKWVQPVSPAVAVEDQMALDADTTKWLYGWASLSNQPGSFSQLFRTLYTTDGDYQVTMIINLCDSPETAKKELAQFLYGCSARFQPGTFSSASVIGDESWFNPNGYSTLIFRAGREMIEIDGDRSRLSILSGSKPPFPSSALEALSYQILLKASQQPDLTGVTSQQASIAINGHALPKNALLVGKQAYVPVQEFAKAMGLTSQWNSKTGALTLSGPKQKTIALTAGSTAASVGGVASPALKTPVLKEAGQPVMTLTDLLSLTGGSIVGQTADTVQVKA